jgi:hypothetical protein
MATDAFKGSKSKLKLGTGSPATFADVFEVTSFGEFGQESELIEATHLESDAMEFIGGLPNGIEVPVTVNYKPTDTSHEGLIAAQQDGLLRWFQFQLPPVAGALTFTFQGVVRRWTIGPTTPNEVVHANFAIKLSGTITGPV